MERTIIHSDANSFYASVEMFLNPSLRGKAVAVCGCVENRHGIVLAKSEAAKKAGIKTGQANWEAKQACPGLITVEPHYDQYIRFSHLLRNIYNDYTDRVEPFGMDECWCDVTQAARRFPSGEALADEIRERVKFELGITVSIGVSFNKIFAKLGSDMKKPDAVTVLSEDNWKERIWCLPVSELLYCGPATTRRLYNHCVYSIGDLAKIPPESVQSWLGKNGTMLWCFANGLDTSRVMAQGTSIPVKSVGHGITCTCDLADGEDVWKVILELAQDVGHRLRLYELAAGGVRLYVRTSTLAGQEYHARLPRASQSPLELARAAQGLFDNRYTWFDTVRSLTITAIDLIPARRSVQLDLFGEVGRSLRRQKFDDCVDGIRGRFGERSIRPASLLGNLHMPDDGREEVRMPGLMYM